MCVCVLGCDYVKQEPSMATVGRRSQAKKEGSNPAAFNVHLPVLKLAGIALSVKRLCYVMDYPGFEFEKE